MGNTLNKPITTKATHTGGELPSGVKWGVSSMQGWRINMEDAHVAEEIREIWDPEKKEIIQLDEPHYFFCVLDGHGGSAAAEYASNHLLQMLKRQPEFVRYARFAGHVEQEESPKNRSKRPSKKKWPSLRSPLRKNNSRDSSRSALEDSQVTALLQRALENSFVDLDLELLGELVKNGTFELAPDPATSKKSLPDVPEEEGEDWGVELIDPEMEVIPQTENSAEEWNLASGTTATAALVTPDMILCANAGDSRTIIDALPLSTDHKPSLPSERQRIIDAMGLVTFNRVDGELAVSRALGDFEFKVYNQSHLIKGIMDMDMRRLLAQSLKVSPFPEVTCHLRSDIDQALILACDGVWDVMTNHDCHELVQTLCEEGENDVGLIAEEILDTCLAKGSRDNMTVLVGLLPGQAFGKGGGVLKRRKNRFNKYEDSKDRFIQGCGG